MKSIFKTIIPLSLVFAVLVSTNFLYAQWTIPSGTPSADNNAPAPINISAVNQVKEGGLSVGALSVADNVYIQGGSATATPSGAVNLEVEGKIGATEFCDTDGNNCFTPTNVSSGSYRYKRLNVGASYNNRYWPPKLGERPSSSVESVVGFDTCFLTYSRSAKRGGLRYNYGGGCALQFTNRTTGEWVLVASAGRNTARRCVALCRR